MEDLVLSLSVVTPESMRFTAINDLPCRSESPRRGELDVLHGAYMRALQHELQLEDVAAMREYQRILAYEVHQV
jgi:hypothetical protein